MSKRTKKYALVFSVLTLLICCSVLTGTTYAWFADAVTSGENKVQSGTLSVDFQVLDKSENQQMGWKSVNNQSRSSSAIFGDNTDWEPGDVQMKILKVQNTGTLALKWKAVLTSSGQISNLANIIDVYVNESITSYPEDRNDLSGWTRVGTFATFLNTIENTLTGSLGAGESKTFGIALKMQGDAAGRYQGMKLGEFGIQILATQDTGETYPEVTNKAQYKYSLPEMETTVTVTPQSDFSQIDFTQNNMKYVFEGTFYNIDIKVGPANITRNQVFDGTKATVTGRVKIGYTDGVINSYDNSIAGKPREGYYVINGFKAKELTTALYNTDIDIVKNKVEFMEVTSGNVKLLVSGNTINCYGSETTTPTSEYGFYLEAVNYDLAFDNNTVSNTSGDAVAINGRQGEGNIAKDLSADIVTNKISSFSKNTVSVQESGKSVLKVWDDTIYAPNTSQTTLTDRAQEVINMVLAGNNTLTLPTSDKTEYLFSFYGVGVNDVQ